MRVLPGTSGPQGARARAVPHRGRPDPHGRDHPPRFKSDLHAFGYQFANLSPAPRELDLARYGFALLRPDPSYSHVFPDGGFISVCTDIEQTCATIARYSRRDAQTWRTLFGRYLAEKEAIAAALNAPLASLAEEAAQAERARGGWDAYRFRLQSLRSWCDETFETDEAKMLVATFGLHIGTAPDDAGGAELAWLFASVIQDLGNNQVKGGMHNLALALAAALKAHGGAVRTGARVDRIVVERGRAVAVRLVDGEEIGIGRLVASAVDPAQSVLRFLGEAVVGPDITRKMQRYEWGDSVMPVYLVLDSPVEFKAGPLAARSAYVHPTPATLDYPAQVYVECRAGLLSARPFALVANATAADTGRVPPGKALMKLVVQPVPYVIKGDVAGTITAREWSVVKDQYANRVIDLLTETYIPDLKRKILKRVVHSPLDIERMFPSAVHGTITHGAFQLYQSGPLRPIPELGHYRSPVANVYLCASGSQPGGGVSMAPGRNAAQVIYADLGLDFRAMVGASPGTA
jgi:beta-carotene ketolase (CrtO type)